MFTQYSDRAIRIVFIARLKAALDGASRIDVPHLLAGVLIEDQGGNLGQEITGIPTNGDHVTTAGRKPSHANGTFFLSTTARRLLLRLDKQFFHGTPNPTAPDLPLSLAVKNILQSAQWLKERFESKQVTPLHVLAAALLRDGPTTAIFRESGITANDVLEVIRSAPSE